MAYPYFDKNNPTGSQTLAKFGTSFRENTAALRDGIIWGYLPTSSSTISQAGGTPSEPTEITVLAGGAERIYSTIGWSSGYMSSYVFKYSPTSSGGTTDTVTTASLSYVAGDLTAISNIGMGPVAKLIPLLGKYKDLNNAYTTHASTSAGTGIHNTGSISTQGYNNVTITGGLVDGATVGSSTASSNKSVNAKYCREYAYMYGTVTGGATLGINPAAGGSLEFTVTGSSLISPATVTTSGNDISGNSGQFQIFTVLVKIPSGAGLQYLLWPGYFHIGIPQTELIDGKTHLFYVMQRSDGVGGVVKILQYAGVLV